MPQDPIEVLYREAMANLDRIVLRAVFDPPPPTRHPLPSVLLHGWLGNALRFGECPSQGRHGHLCPPTSPCSYCCLLGPRQTPSLEQTENTLPPLHPFSLQATHSDWNRGILTLVFLGKGVKHAGAVVRSLDRAARHGFTRDRIVLTLRRIENLGPNGQLIQIEDQFQDPRPFIRHTADQAIQFFEENAPIGQPQKISARSPLHLTAQHRFVQRPTPRLIAVNALRRAASLVLHQGPGFSLPPPSPQWLSEIENLKPDSEQWSRFKCERYSTRQKQVIYLKGLLGEMVVTGGDAFFLFSIAAAAVLGLGKYTTFGMGQIKIRPV